MTWLLPASIATACGVSILFAVNLYLYIAYRQRFLGFWAAGWGVHALRFLSMIAGIVFGESLLTELGYYFFIILSTTLLLTGCRIFIGKRPSHFIFTLAAIIFLIALTALLLKLPLMYLHVPVFGFLALANIYMGSLIIKNRNPDEKIALLVGGLFILWGLHQADYPFLRPIIWFAPWGYLLTSLLALTSAIGLVIIYFERTQKELLFSEERFRTVADFTYGWEYWEDAEHKILYMSPSCERITGYARAEFIANPGLLTQLVHPDDRSRFEAHRHGISSPEDGILEFRIIRRDGAVCWIEHLCHSVSGSGGESAGRRVSNRDITDRKQAEEALHASERRFKELIKNSSDCIVILDKDGLQIYVSDVVEKILGYKPSELVNIPVIKEMIHPEDQESAQAAFLTIVREGQGGAQYRHRHKNGSWVYLEAWGTNQLENPDICGVVVNVRDITERKQAEDKIRQTLKEKETLLKEIHHRVKNNMSVISGLLYLMSDRIEDETMKALFEESRQWIKSMALVHEKIYRTENLARIDFSDYIHSLVHDLLSSYHAKGREISTKINVRDIVLDINTAIPCGQIINELITNAMKYAFQEKTGGEISISFTKTDDVYTLIVKDNGIGLPVGFDHTKTNTLGLQLVDALTRQLRGTLQFRSDAAARQGTEVIITFREKDRGAQL